MTYTISAVIPVYNGEAFLQEAIQSVLEQSHPVSEIVIVDDGSKDNSYDIAITAARTSPIPIRIFRQKNSGVSAARNVGVTFSSSILIAFLDVDDIWYPTKIERQIALYKHYDDENLFVFSDYYHDREQEQARKFFVSQCPAVCTSQDYSPQIFQKAFLTDNFVGTASTVMFNRELCLKINGFNVQLNHSEDFDFVLRYSNHAHVKAIDSPLVMKRHHGANLSGNFELHAWSHMISLLLCISLNNSFARYNFSPEVLGSLKTSYDSYLLKYCNACFERSFKEGMRAYMRGFTDIKTPRGFMNLSGGFLRKVVRLLSFNLIKR